MRQITRNITAAEDGWKIKSYLRRRLFMADVLISRLKWKPDGILLNGRHAVTTEILHEGDCLCVDVSDSDGRNEATAADIPLDFIYEDEDLAVLNKCAGMAVHGSPGGEGVTVANALAFRWSCAQAFHPVNRLDRGTTGLMVIAKSAYVHDLLRRQLHTDEFRREYLALAEGHMENPEGSICLPIEEDSASSTKRRTGESGLPSRTDYLVLRRETEFDLLQLRLHTGRTHQIRVHLAAVGHPLLGDALYGGTEERIQRPALHSARIFLKHPVSGDELKWEVPLPEDMQQLLQGDGTK